MRAWGFDDPDGEDLSEVGVLWVRLSRGSIEMAKEAAKKEGVADRIHFEVASAKGFPGKDYDFVAFFDCLHDMGDPKGAAAYVRSTLKPDGTWMIVEPYARGCGGEPQSGGDGCFIRLRTLRAGFDVAGGWRAAGAQAGPARLEKVVRGGGFTHFRKAAETPFNMVFEAR